MKRLFVNCLYGALALSLGIYVASPVVRRPVAKPSGGLHTFGIRAQAHPPSARPLVSDRSSIPHHRAAQPAGTVDLVDSSGARNFGRPPGLASDALPAASLAMTIFSGDNRSPPIAKEVASEALPGPDPTDHESYARHELQQQNNLYARFEHDASIAVTEMQQTLQQARQRGGPADKIIEGEQKAQVLQQTLEAIRGTAGVP
ncbi:hypothetical protein [Agrilutibacter solisilvae]|uniref:Uncharacterized protein n=1 Tax=Agrilutibacter solisilvae TaxID=2763317 RepID=A0A974XZ46_9GAMM|nr:hypothetical protein [Lysobacter solisilvae]QSX77505.1 hypothetical protein I8J32_012165 [Lysobacter solisilvae]